MNCRDQDAFVEAGFALARGIPVSWLLHPNDDALPFMVGGDEAIVTANVLDATAALKNHFDRASPLDRPLIQSRGNRVFFSAPYDDMSENRFHAGIAPPLRAAGFQPFFARHALSPGNAPAQVFDKIRESCCLVADVSDRSPNVSLEVGYALGVGIDVLLIQNSRARYPEGDLASFLPVKFDSLPDLSSKMEKAVSKLTVVRRRPEAL